jgi:DNA-binding IclR family transcriptional regulator
MSQSLDRGLRILDEIAAGRTSLGEIAQSLEVHKGTVLRLLTTLQQHHFVYRDDPSHYHLGRRLFDLAAFALDGRQVVAHARDAMRSLGQSTGRGSYLATLEGDEVVVVETDPGRNALQTVPRIGEALPAHATAGGKVLLAGLPAKRLDALLARLPLDGLTDRTATDVAAVRDEVAKVTSAGFALELGEFQPHLDAVAAPVRDFSGKVVAALAITVPSVSFAEQELTRYVPELLAGAAEASRELGWD